MKEDFLKERGIKTGISYGSAIQEVEHLKEVSADEFAFIELPLGTDGEYRLVREYAEAENIELSLHIPSMEMLAEFPFIVDVQNSEQVNTLLDFIRKKVKSRLPLLYIVVHMPLITKSRDPEKVNYLNRLYIQGVSGIAADSKVPIFVENTAVHPFFYRAEHYSDLLDFIDGICLDVGHAHTIEYILLRNKPLEDHLREMTELLQKEICCMHLYNTISYPDGRYSPRQHYPNVPAFDNVEGFIKQDVLEKTVRELPSLKFIVLEPHRQEVKNYRTFGYIPGRER